MSRSFRYTNKVGNVHRISEAFDKQNWHQRLRVKIRTTLSRFQENLEEYLDPDKRGVSQPEAMAKHGKSFITPAQIGANSAIGVKRKELGLCK